MSDDHQKEAQTSISIYDEEGYREVVKKAQEKGMTFSEFVHEQVIKPNAHMSKVERLERQVEETEEELELAKQNRDEAIRRVDELTAHLENLQNRLEQARQERETYDEAIQEVITSRYDNKIARTHDDIQKIAREYDKITDEVVEDLREAGMEIVEVDANV